MCCGCRLSMNPTCALCACTETLRSTSPRRPSPCVAKLTTMEAAAQSAASLKDQGNAAFSHNKFDEALQLYSQAIDLAEQHNKAGKLNEQLGVFYRWAAARSPRCFHGTACLILFRLCLETLAFSAKAACGHWERPGLPMQGTAWLSTRSTKATMLSRLHQEIPAALAPPSFCSNRSATHLGLKDYDAAISDAEAAIRIRPNWDKASVDGVA